MIHARFIWFLLSDGSGSVTNAPDTGTGVCEDDASANCTPTECGTHPAYAFEHCGKTCDTCGECLKLKFYTHC